MNTKYIVWVGGIDDHYASEEEAKKAKQEWIDEVTTADVLDWLGNENSFSTVVEILTALLNGTETLENIRNEVQGE